MALPAKKELSTLPDTALLKEWKGAKQNRITYCVLLGVMIGLAIYSTVKNGF